MLLSSRAKQASHSFSSSRLRVYAKSRASNNLAFEFGSSFHVLRTFNLLLLSPAVCADLRITLYVPSPRPLTLPPLLYLSVRPSAGSRAVL